MSLKAMASNQKRPRLLSLDETVFMCADDDHPPCLDDSDDHTNVRNIYSVSITC